MKTAIIVPKFAEGAEDIKLRQWLVGPGESVEAGQNIAEIATDKISAYIEAPAAGTITALLAEEKDWVAVGQTIGEMEAL
ncbi:lipoyl domain-containing protein [Eubacterium aggregans]|uniref:lipoyl domain-containing protein n=1 Tax=Eubacterium aggregans TaxID=81409 RepID=UPI003F39229F